MENDQGCERPKDARQVYTNALISQVCPILALVMYLLCYSDISCNMTLFPGSSQDELFRRILERVCNTDDMKDELLSRGLTVDDLGTHIFRNGSATHVATGSTASPPVVTIYLRAGWALHGVQDTSLRYEAAGEHYVGRVACGFPLDDPNFALLPPHFIDRSIIHNLVGFCFPNLPDAMTRISEFCPASIIYH